MMDSQPQPILQYPLHYRENEAQTPPAFTSLQSDPIPPSRPQQASLQSDGMAQVASIPDASGHTDSLQANYAGQTSSAASRQSASQRERFILRIRREAELLADPSNNSAHMAMQYFPHLFAPSAVPAVDPAPSSTSSYVFPFSSLLADTSIWRSQSLNYDALRNQMKKIVYIQGQICSFICEQESSTAKPDAETRSSSQQGDFSVSRIRADSEEDSLQSRKDRDRTPRPLDPTSPLPTPGALSSTTLSALTSHPSIQTLRQSHLTFWKLLKSEVEKMSAFMEQEVHAQRTASVWSAMINTNATNHHPNPLVDKNDVVMMDTTAGRPSDAIPPSQSLAAAATVQATITASEPSICSCGCGSVLKEVFRYVLQELLQFGVSSSTATLTVDGRETSVCKLAKETTQKFMCSLLHMDQIRKYLTHNYIIYQRVLDQYRHYTACPMLDKYHTQLGLTLPAPPSLAPPIELTVQQQHLQSFLATTTPFTPLVTFIRRMARAEVLAVRSFERGRTFENIGSEMAYLLASQGPPTCGICQSTTLAAPMLLPCAHTYCFSCLAVQPNFGVCCPLPQCQRELTVHADMKPRVSMEEWMRAGAIGGSVKAEPVAATVVQPVSNPNPSTTALPALLPAASVSAEQLKLQRKLWALHLHQQQGSNVLSSVPLLDDQKISPTMSSFSEDDSSMAQAGVAPASSITMPPSAHTMVGIQIAAAGVIGGTNSYNNQHQIEAARRATTNQHINAPTPNETGAGANSRPSSPHPSSLSGEDRPVPGRRRYSLGDGPTGMSSQMHSRTSSMASEELDETAHASLFPFESRQLYVPPPFGAHRRSDENAMLIAQHQPCEGDDQPVNDEDLEAGRFILGCGGTIAAPLAYEEVTTRNPDGTITVQMKPKRGQGYSCHHCKTTKEPLLLFFCSNLVQKGKNLKKCQKKYCESCLKRLYAPEFSQGGRYWSCPSCKSSCVCASCERKITGHAAPKKKKNTASGVLEATVLAGADFDPNLPMPMQTDVIPVAQAQEVPLDPSMHDHPDLPPVVAASSNPNAISFANSIQAGLPSVAAKSIRGRGGHRGGRGRGPRTPTKLRSRSNSLDVTGEPAIARIFAQRYTVGTGMAAEEFSPLSSYQPGSESNSPAHSPMRPTPLGSASTGSVHRTILRRGASVGDMVHANSAVYNQSSRSRQTSRGHTPSREMNEGVAATLRSDYHPMHQRKYSTSQSQVAHSHSSSPYHMVSSAGSSIPNSNAGSHVGSDNSDADTPTNRMAMAAAVGRSISPPMLGSTFRGHRHHPYENASSGIPMHHRAQTYDSNASAAAFPSTKSDLASMSLEELHAMNERLEAAMRQLQADELDGKLGIVSGQPQPRPSAPTSSSPLFSPEDRDLREFEKHLLRQQHKLNQEQASLLQQAKLMTHVRAAKKNLGSVKPTSQSQNANSASQSMEIEPTRATHALSIATSPSSSAASSTQTSMSIQVTMTPSHTNESDLFLSNLPPVTMETPSAALLIPKPTKNAESGLMSPLDAPLLSPQMLDDMLSPAGFLQPHSSPSFSSGGGSSQLQQSSSASHVQQLAPLNMNLMTPMPGHLLTASPSWPAHGMTQLSTLGTPSGWNEINMLQTPNPTVTNSQTTNQPNTNDNNQMRLSPTN